MCLRRVVSASLCPNASAADPGTDVSASACDERAMSSLRSDATPTRSATRLETSGCTRRTPEGSGGGPPPPAAATAGASHGASLNASSDSGDSTPLSSGTNSAPGPAVSFSAAAPAPARAPGAVPVAAAADGRAAGVRGCGSSASAWTAASACASWRGPSGAERTPPALPSTPPAAPPPPPSPPPPSPPPRPPPTTAAACIAESTPRSCADENAGCTPICSSSDRNGARSDGMT
eukprot:359666-Chlamydomonas_euryale.AAC.5